MLVIAAVKEPLGEAPDAMTGDSVRQMHDMNSSVVGPFAIASMRLADGGSEIQCLAIRCERGARDAGFGVERSQAAFHRRQRARHSTFPGPAGQPSERHRSERKLASPSAQRRRHRRVFGRPSSAARLPIPTLPGHFAVACHRIGHRPHATAQQRSTVRREREPINPTAVVRALDDAPAREIGRSEISRPLASRQGPKRATSPIMFAAAMCFPSGEKATLNTGGT